MKKKARKTRWQIREELKQKREQSEAWSEKLKKFKDVNSQVLDKSKEFGGNIWKKSFVPILRLGRPDFNNIRKMYGKKVGTVFKKILKRSVKAEDSFLKLANEIILISIICLVLLNLFTANNRFKNKSFLKAVRAVNYWPKIPTTLMVFSKEAFLWGNQEYSDVFFELASKNLESYSKIGLSWIFEDEYKKLGEYVIIPKNKALLIDKVNKQMVKQPYSWRLLLKKSELEAELFMNAELETDIKEFEWLYPTISNKYKKDLLAN